MRIPDDAIEGLGVVGLIMVVYSAGYLRGRFAASGMDSEAWAMHVAEVGPYWPSILFGVGMVILGASAMTLYMEHRRRSKAERIKI